MNSAFMDREREEPKSTNGPLTSVLIHVVSVGFSVTLSTCGLILRIRSGSVAETEQSMVELPSLASCR